jgi:hypothetical protein
MHVCLFFFTGVVLSLGFDSVYASVVFNGVIIASAEISLSSQSKVKGDRETEAKAYRDIERDVYVDRDRGRDRE